MAKWFFSPSEPGVQADHKPVPAVASGTLSPVEAIRSAVRPMGSDSSKHPDPTKPSISGAPSAAAPDLSAVLWVNGYVIRQGRINVLLSDGRTITELDNGGNGRPFLQVVERQGIILDGVKIYVRPAGPGTGKPETLANLSSPVSGGASGRLSGDPAPLDSRAASGFGPSAH